MNGTREKHTPGPWVYHEDCSGPARITNGGWDALRIADVWSTDLDAGANARLIAAAPDLLAAAKALFDLSLVHMPDVPGAHTIMARAGDAIARAKGE